MSKKKKKKVREGGHYEEKTVFIIPWGAIVCWASFAIGPFYMGTGLAFLIIPAQLASLLLIPFFKKVKVPVFIKDKKAPTTKIAREKIKSQIKTQQNAKNKEFKKEKGSFVEMLQKQHQTQNLLSA